MQAVESCFLLLLFALPVFSDGGNLSFVDCGKWERNTSDIVPWRARINHTADFCYGIVVSDNTIVSIFGWRQICYEMESGDLSEKPINAYLGTCYKNHGDPKCAQDSKGVIVKVLKVTRLQLAGEIVGLAWKTERIAPFPDYVWPICLFNRDNRHDLDAQSPFSNYYAMWNYGDSCIDVSFVPVEGCQRNGKTMTWLQKQGTGVKLLCVDNDTLFGRRYLINYYGGRHFWRASDLVPYNSPPLLAYADMIPFIPTIAQQIATN